MQPVKIRIVSSGRNGGEALPAAEQRYSGRLTEKNGKYYALYEEDGQSGLEGTRTTLKWDSERLIIVRSGSVEHRQEFCRGLSSRSVYRTPYLEIPLTTETSYLYTYFRRGIWRIEAEYKLYHGADIYGEMKILIEIEEDQQVGH